MSMRVNVCAARRRRHRRAAAASALIAARRLLVALRCPLCREPVTVAGAATARAFH